MGDSHFNISITQGTVVKVLVIGVLAWALYLILDVVLIVLTAIVIASAIEPAVRFLMRRRAPRTIAVLVVYMILLTLFFGIFYLFVPSILEDFAKFVSSLPSYLETVSTYGTFDAYTRILGLPSPSDVSASGLMESVRDALNLGAYGNPFSAVATIFGGMFSLILIVVFSFYFALVETGVDDFLRIVAPVRYRSYALDLWRRSQHKIGLWMQGQLLLAVVVGVLVFLLLTIFGVPHALMLAVLAGIFEIIPVFGPTLAAIPGVLLAFAAGGIPLGLTALAIYVAVQIFENHLIYPLVVTRVVGVPPLLVILALIVGADLAGFLGVILSVPVAAVVQEFIRDMQEGRLPSAQS